MRRSRRIVLDSALVSALFLMVASWFTTSLLGPRAVALLGMVTLTTLLVSRWRILSTFRPRPGAALISTLLVCGVGLALRAPAFIEPAGFVGADGSLQAILVNVILDGPRPAPVFLETSSYQGSLKAHIGALASVFLGRDDLGLLVVVGSVVLWTIFTASLMALGRRLGGTAPAVVAGLFVALSPRFATIFSISNVGEYPDALALGTWAMAWAAALLANGRRGFEARWSFFGIGLLLGIALWQQPIALSFGIASLGLLSLRALAGRDPWFLVSLLGFTLGRLPVTIHDFQAASSNSEAVGSFLRMAGKSLPLNEHVRGTFEWAFPIVFAGLSNDSTLGVGGRIALGLSCMALFCLFLVRAAAELKTAIKDRSWALVRVMAATTFLAGLAFVWLVGGGGQYTRPRYFLPLLCGFALALGDISGALWKRWPLAAVALAGSVIGWNTWSNLDRLRSGLEEGRNLRAFSEKIEGLGLRTGYSGVAVAGPLIMLTGERVSVDGVLGSTVGERLPARHIDRVRLHGPDFYLADQDASDRLTRRFGELGVTYEIARAPGTLVLFHGFSRPVALSEVRE